VDGKWRKGFRLDFRPYNVYFLSSHGSEMEPRIRMATEFISEVKNETKNETTKPIPSVIQKEKSLTCKDLSKSGRIKFFI
jgi:hypothetical protein